MSQGRWFPHRGPFSCPVPQRLKQIVNLDEEHRYRYLVQRTIVAGQLLPILQPFQRPFAYRIHLKSF